MLMALAVSLEPFRIGMTVVMVNRPRPALQLLAFLAGGFVMGTAVGVVVLFVLRPALDSTQFTLPVIQIVVGAVVLANAALIAAGWIGRAPSGDGRLLGVARRLFGGRSLWIAGVAGLGIALPSVDYLAALALIVASGAAASVQFGALITFNVVAFALVEVPLLAYLVAPEQTRAALIVVHDRVRAGGRRAVAALLAAVGGVLVGVGVLGL